MFLILEETSSAKVAKLEKFEPGTKAIFPATIRSLLQNEAKQSKQRREAGRVRDKEQKIQKAKAKGHEYKRKHA